MHKLAAMKLCLVSWCTTRFYFGSSFMKYLLFSFPNRLFVAHSLQPDSFTQALFSEMHKLAANKSGILAKFLQPLLIHHKVPSLVLSNKVTRATGIINEPVGGSDNPLRFTAGLALSVFMDCALENVQDLQRVQVQVSSTLCKGKILSGDAHIQEAYNDVTHVWSSSLLIEMCKIDLLLEKIVLFFGVIKW